MKRKLAGLMVVSMLALAVAMPAANANHSMGGGYGHHRGWGKKGDFESKFFFKTHFILRHAGELEITDKQQEEIKNLKHEIKKSLVRQDAEIKIIKLDIEQQMRASSINTEAVNKLVDQKFELKKAKSKLLVEAIAKLKKSLSEEQHKKMKDLFKQGKAWKKG